MSMWHKIIIGGGRAPPWELREKVPLVCVQVLFQMFQFQKKNPTMNELFYSSK